MTARAFVVGHPISHSLSPRIHNAAFAALDIDARYEAVDVEPRDLATWISELRDQQVLGCNVTIPYKEAVIPCLDGLRGDAQAAGAVNTLAWEADDDHHRPSPHLVGHNTDTLGFLRSVQEDAGRSLRGARVLLLGAGGAARAIGVVAVREEAASLTIANRDPARASQLVAHLSGLAPAIPMRAMALEADGLTAALEEATLIINSTSVGLRSETMPIDPSPVDSRALMVDIVYNPPLTPLLRAASARGIQTLGGIGMLTYQAAAAFELWTGAAAPLAAMRRAAEGAIAELPHV